MDRELRHVVAGIEAARLAPDFLAVAVEIIQLVGADRGRIEPVQQPEAGEFADRMRQRVDADAEFADGVGLLEQFAVDAARAQHQRGGEAADAASDDDRLHPLKLHSTTRRVPCRRRSVRTGRHYSAASGFVASAFSSARVFGLALILRSSKSCRSRTLLRKICSLPGRYCGGQAISGAVPGRRPHRERRIDQMRPAERHQVGAAGGEDGVDLVGGRDVADAHGGDPGLVADLVGERRLEHAAVDRLRVAHGLAGRDIDQIDAGLARRRARSRPRRRR